MRNVTVSKEELLKIVHTNREKHIELYKEASAGYYNKLREELVNALHSLDDIGKVSRKGIRNLVKPRNHMNGYDLALQMLNVSVDDNIELDSHTFEKLYNNVWEWTREFASGYTSNTGKDY